MLSREGKQTDRGAVGAEFIGYNRRRREALLLQEFPHQPNCRPSVPAGLNQEIQDFALTVHGTPEIELPPSNYDDHLVQVPAFGRSWPPTLNPPRIGPTEFQDPSSNCLIRDVETTLGKQVLNVPIAQRETAIEPDGMLDDDRWKAVTTVGYLAHPETLKHRPCRSHAVNVTMPWAGKMQRLLRRACHAVNLAREQGVALKPSLVSRFRRCWDAITAEGIAFHEAQPPLAPKPVEGKARRRGRKPRRVGHNLLRRLQARKEDALRFLTNFAVPFTNNQAEQDGRMMKVKQKISGGFRSQKGAEDFATVRGFISTARKQGWNIIQALMENPETLIARLHAA